MEMGSSVVFTDSIPVAALLFKLARDALPDHFQYFGMWTFACYILQGGFGWLISGLFTRIALQRLAMTALFVLSPLLPDRGIGHYALMAHWLVLAALYLYLRAPTRLATASWCLLICGAALIHVLSQSHYSQGLVRPHVPVWVMVDLPPFLAVWAPKSLPM